MFESRPYVVTIRTTQRRTFLVDARTVEDAEDVAVAYLEDGEPGTVEAESFHIEDSYAVEAPEEIDDSPAVKSARLMNLAELDGDETFEATTEVFS